MTGTQPESDIVIVGGGAAGLTTAGALKHVGLDAIVLDQDDQIGGTWARRYSRLHLHSVRQCSGLAHYPIPRSFPKYVPKDQFVQYLRSYAQHFQVNWIGNCPASKVKRGASGDWIVESRQGAWRCRVAVIATGHFGAPFIPEWPTRAEYRGQFMHSIDYRTGRNFAGQRALVIGSGNSGTEIACDLAEQGAAYVANSIRTAPPVVPRDYLGTPVQVFGILLSPLPARLADWLGTIIARLAIGDLRQFGARPAAWRPFSAHRIPIIDVGWVKELKRGRITLKPDITRFTATGVVYEDRTAEDFDVVIAATGFNTRLDQLIEVPGLIDERGYPKYRSGQPTSEPGLYFMGYTESVRGHLFEANRDSRRLARLIKMTMTHD